MRAVRRAVPGAPVYVLGTATVAGSQHVVQASAGGGQGLGLESGANMAAVRPRGVPWARLQPCARRCGFREVPIVHPFGPPATDAPAIPGCPHQASVGS